MLRFVFVFRKTIVSKHRKDDHCHHCVFIVNSFSLGYGVLSVSNFSLGINNMELKDKKHRNIILAIYFNDIICEAF